MFASVDRAKRHKGITAFVVERGMPGLTTGTLHGKLGIRAGNTGLIDFEDVRVPVENRIGEEGEGFLIAMSAIDQGRYTVAAGAVGLAQACLDASVRYAHERETFGQEIGQHQLVKQMIANMAKGTEIGRLLVWQAGWLKNQGLRNTRETSLAKWHATEHSVQAALDAIQIHGANGYSNEFPVERYLRNSKAAVIYEGTSQLHTLIQADYALGYREDRPLRCEPWPAEGFARPRLALDGRRQRPVAAQLASCTTSSVIRRAIPATIRSSVVRNTVVVAGSSCREGLERLVAQDIRLDLGVRVDVGGPLLAAEECELADHVPGVERGQAARVRPTPCGTQTDSRPPVTMNSSSAGSPWRTRASPGGTPGARGRPRAVRRRPGPGPASPGAGRAARTAAPGGRPRTPRRG